MNPTIIIVLVVCLLVIIAVVRNQSAMLKIDTLLKSGALVVDVRSEQEYRAGHFGGAVNIPYDECERRIPELGENRARPIILYCHAGSRSAMAHEILRKNGFSRVFNARSYAVMKRFERKSK
jgi:phage shock protein E